MEERSANAPKLDATNTNKPIGINEDYKKTWKWILIYIYIYMIFLRKLQCSEIFILFCLLRDYISNLFENMVEIYVRYVQFLTKESHPR